MEALYKLDNADKSPVVVIDAMSLSLIPRPYPEELNISLIDRLNRIEERMENMEEGVDRVVRENLEIKDQMKVRCMYAQAVSKLVPTVNASANSRVT